jgi:hypothetical protein
VSAGPAHELLDGLAGAVAALGAGDAIAASAELDRVVAACATLDAAGVRLDEDTLDAARRRWHACATAAQHAERGLAEQLQTAGLARRAAGAYRQPHQA